MWVDGTLEPHAPVMPYVTMPAENNTVQIQLWRTCRDLVVEHVNIRDPVEDIRSRASQEHLFFSGESYHHA